MNIHFNYDGPHYALTDEDKAVLLRALSRGMDSVNTIMPMMRDGQADSQMMYDRVVGRILDEQAAYYAEEQLHAWAQAEDDAELGYYDNDEYISF